VHELSSFARERRQRFHASGSHRDWRGGSGAGARVAELTRTRLPCNPNDHAECRADQIRVKRALATLVSFSNDLAGVCEALPDTDVDANMDAVHLDRRLTPIVDGRPITPGIVTYLRAGSGFGGSCLPKDVTALRLWARSIHAATPLLDAVMQINELRPQQVAALVDTAAGGVRGRPIAVLGRRSSPAPMICAIRPRCRCSKRWPHAARSSAA
jgi:UDPglucose 6-dehydrogenase/GDP-mannose 6-dehydrogenase